MKDLSLHIIDLAQNSIRAGATLVEITITEDPVKDQLALTIRDNGKGMDEQTAKKADDPWCTSRTTRKVGMGLPLIKQNAERTGGTFHLDSVPGSGTTVKAVFGLKHLDRPPVGNISEAVVLLSAGSSSCDFVYSHTTPKGTYVFDTREVKEVLGPVQIGHPKVIKTLMEMVENNLKEIEISD